jgi:hypothetical protein
MIRVVHPGSRIRMLTFFHPGPRIQGSKRHPIPDPGSGSATLLLIHVSKDPDTDRSRTKSNVADPDPGSGDLLTPGSGIRIRDEQPGSYFFEPRPFFGVKILKFFDADPRWKKFGSAKLAKRFWFLKNCLGNKVLSIPGPDPCAS